MNILFKGIQSKLSDHIASAKFSIQIGVAWFTNKELLSYLTEKVISGVKVQVLISDDIINNRLSFEKFIYAGGQLIVSSGSRFLHEKFALFDEKILIMGSYNWTYGAEYNNYESVIISDNELLIKSYTIRFRNLWSEVANSQNLFKSHHSAGFEKQEEEYKKLENELEAEILVTLAELIKLKVPIDRTIVLDMIYAYGAIGTCRKVLEKGNDDSKIPSGFLKLAMADRINQSFEYMMTREKYRVLFSDKILELAEERLKKFSR
jgi:hypothetical protein